MLRMNDVIEVLCMVFPDGTTLWIDDTNNARQRVIDAWQAWRARLSDDIRARYDVAKVLGGFVLCRMLREDFQAIAANNKGQ